MKKFLFAIITALSFAGVAVAMSEPQPQKKSADAVAQLQTEQLMKEASMQTGMPGMVDFTEKKMVKWLYELRDKPNYATETFIVTMTGEFVKICDSVGYGINASIQYSNPERVLHRAYSSSSGASYGAVTIPQPEPNGLFMPEGLAATYVICVDAEKDDVQAVYIEPEIIVFPAGLHN